MKIELDSLERRMIITALTRKEGNFYQLIQDSQQTPTLYRKTWKKLVEKLAQDEMLHEEVRDSMGKEKKIIIPN